MEIEKPFENQEMEMNEQIEYRIILKEIKGTNNVEKWIEEIKKELDSREIKYDIREPNNEIKGGNGNGNQSTYPYAYFENVMDKLNNYIRFKSSNTVLKKKENTISNLFNRFVSNKKEEPIDKEDRNQEQQGEPTESIEKQEEIEEQEQGEPKESNHVEQYNDEYSVQKTTEKMTEIVIYIENKKVPNLIKEMKDTERFRNTIDFINGFK
jgi:hypothetical protein